MHTLFTATALAVCEAHPSVACTGITLSAADGSRVVARTIEWCGSDLRSRYVIVPRGYTQHSYTPDGKDDGMAFTSRLGYVGLAVEQAIFIAEGINEAGLSAGLFYFPRYGSYAPYDPAHKNRSIADLQLVAWILGACSDVEEVREAVRGITVIGTDPRADTAHWRFADASGRQVVLEIVDGIPRFYNNPLGVLTNAPGFEWQLTNLDNYVNLRPGNPPARPFGSIKLAPFGAGSGMLGLPGDMTPPSRFVRAAFFQTTAPQRKTALETVLQCFQILNNFDIPIGIEFDAGEVPADIPSATQWTSVTDMTHRTIYYRTMYDSTIRSIDLRQIDFERTAYRSVPLDDTDRQPVHPIRIE